MPKLSIITINLNNLPGLQKTMQSVFEQSFSDYEYIVIDGGSIDGSKEYIAQYSNKLSYWVSENDKGIFNAMNKGIKNSKGEYLIFLNSGDYLYNEAILNNIFSQEHDQDIIYGNVIWQPTPYDGTYPDILTYEHFKNNTIPHQASFIKKSLFHKVGYYNENDRINSDWFFFLLAVYKFNCTYLHLNQIVSYCNTEGLSLQPEEIRKTAQIRKDFIQAHFSAFEKDYTSLRDLRNELQLVKKTKGYKIQKKIKRVLDKLLKLQK